MKTYLTALLSFLIAPVLAFAALDVSMSGSSVITVGGINLTVSGTATLDYITVGSDSFDVRLSPGATITVSSADRKTLTVTPTTGYTTANTCASDASSITLDMPSTHPGPYVVLTVTPSSTACDASSGGGSPGATSGSGSGGGGGSVPTPVYTVIPGTDSSSSAASVSSAASSASSEAGAVVTRTTTGQTTTQTVSTPSGVTVTITRTLKQGMENSEVRNLQELLALDPEVYPEGKVTGYYGSLTRKAVKAFQKKHGIASGGDENTTGYGLVGPKTLAKIKEVFGTQQIVTETVKTVETPSAATTVLTKLLKQGMEGDEVVILQELLARDPEIYPEAKVTGYYGSLTRKAVVRFQQKYGLEPVGHVGPMTRAKLMELYGSSTGSGQVPTGSEQAVNQTESQSQNPATEQNSGSGQGSVGPAVSESQSAASSASSVETASQSVSSGSGSGGSGGAGVGQSSPAQTYADQQIQQLIDQINAIQGQINALQ